MILNISYRGHDTTKISYLFFKNPSRPQIVELNYGRAYIFYTKLSDEETTISLLLDINPIDLVRGKTNYKDCGLFDYVNDRPYVTSSFMSTAISIAFGTALTGRADEYQYLSDSDLDLEAEIIMLPYSGDFKMINRIFEPLGYEVSYEAFISDEKFPEWGESKYINLKIKGNLRLRDLLKHIYVLIPVFDRNKHYWFGKDEVDKLLRNTEDWLKEHPEKNFITGRYLNRQKSLINLALNRLDLDDNEEVKNIEVAEKKDKYINLNTKRLNIIVDTLKSLDIDTIIDIGCGEGKLLNRLIRESQFKKIAGTDVSYSVLEKASKKLKLDRINEYLLNKITLFQSSLTYKDNRFKNYDAVCVIEVIEHLDLYRLEAFERVLFEFTKPKYIILTTPNKEYNELFEHINSKSLRHGDHRFEWTRNEFIEWTKKITLKYGYSVKISEIGDIHEKYGAPTQMGVFTLCV